MAARYLLLLFSLLILSLPLTAFADNEDARELYNRGSAAFRRGDYNRAIKEWQTAYDISKKPRFQFIMAQAYERLGKLSEAITLLERYLETAHPKDSNQSDAAALLASLQQRVAATGIIITDAPDNASIIINNKKWGYTPRPDRIPVQPGSHKVIVQKKGYERFVSTVFVPAGQIATVTVELEEKTSQGFKEPSEETDSAISSNQKKDNATDTAEYSSSNQGGSSSFLYILSGVLAAGTIGSAIWMFDRIDNYNKCKNPEDEKKTCDNLDELSTEKTVMIATTATLGTAAIAVLVAAIWSGSSESKESEQTTALCSPLLGTGASCTFRF